MKAIGALALILIGLGIFYFALNSPQSQPEIAAPPRHRTDLEAKIEADLETLSQNKEIPYPWSSFKELRQAVISANQLGKVPAIKLQIPTDPNGTYRLSYSVIAEQIENPESRLMIQFEIIDIKSNSKVWEKIRIYDR